MLRQKIAYVLFALHLTVASLAVAAEPLNVLLICVDDLKPTIHCFGDPVAVTPNIDALAERGVLFESAYCNQAVCSPSRNSLLSGLRPQTIGIYDLPTNFRKGAPDAITVGQHFKNQGYHTQGLGKIFHTGHGNFDDEATWSVPSWRPQVSTYARDESELNRVTDSRGKVRGPATEAVDVPDEAYADGKVADEALVRLKQVSQKPDQPFFLAVGFIRPHLPFVAPKRYWDLYNAAELPMPEIFSPPVGAPSYAPTSSGELFTYAEVPKPVDGATTRHLIRGYYAATSYTDAQIGKLLDALDRLGLGDKTIVVLWGDHGWHLGDHGMWCKHTNYEQAARIPLIVAAPGGAHGAKSSALVESVDVYPTLADLANISAPAGLDGKSFANVVADPSAPGREFAQHVYPRSGKIGRALRTHRYRLVEWKKPGDPAETADIELYDYAVDPLETKNLAADKPEVVAELRNTLAQLPEAKPQWKEN